MTDLVSESAQTKHLSVHKAKTSHMGSFTEMRDVENDGAQIFVTAIRVTINMSVPSTTQTQTLACSASPTPSQINSDASLAQESVMINRQRFGR